MLRRLNLKSICLLISLSIVIMVGIRYTCIDYNIPTSNTRFSALNYQRTDGEIMQQAKTVGNLPNIEKLLDKTRRRIKLELNGYDFSHSGVKELEDLLMEYGGNPVRSLVVSSWRSGSTFLGQVLNAVRSNFYHYEPLLKYRIIQVRGPPLGDKSIKAMMGMFSCNYSGIEDYFNYGKTNLQQFSHNTRLWEHCKNNNELCYDPDFTGRFCKLFPFQSMKVVRLSLRLVEEILLEEDLNVKVVLLIRDPRGVMQSRRHRNFCKPAPDCSKPERLCAEMISSYEAAKMMLQRYPGRFTVVRFEELALKPNATVTRLLQFLRLGSTEPVQEFVQTHTKFEIAGVNSTYRVSRDVVFKWINMFDFSSIDHIQKPCKKAMKLWGYLPAHNASHLASRDYYPILPYNMWP